MSKTIRRSTIKCPVAEKNYWLDPTKFYRDEFVRISFRDNVQFRKRSLDWYGADVQDYIEEQRVDYTKYVRDCSSDNAARDYRGLREFSNPKVRSATRSQLSKINLDNYKEIDIIGVRSIEREILGHWAWACYD